MHWRQLRGSAAAFGRPYWYVLGVGLALIAAAFLFASRTLVIFSRTFFIHAEIYVLLQVAGWVILLEWLRLTGHLTLTDTD